MAHDGFSLPPQTISLGDLMHLKRELAALDDFIRQSELRSLGHPLKTPPKASTALNNYAALNHLNFLHAEDRQKGIDFLDFLSVHAPRAHISFASEPSAPTIHKIAGWFRDNIDPLLLLNIGIEPSIAVGFTLSTDNHYHDFSLRQHFSNQRDLLIEAIAASDEAKRS